MRFLVTGNNLTPFEQDTLVEARVACADYTKCGHKNMRIWVSPPHELDHLPPEAFLAREARALDVGAPEAEAVVPFKAPSSDDFFSLAQKDEAVSRATSAKKIRFALLLAELISEHFPDAT